MRIPTLAGLILLIIALGLGIFLSYQYHDRQIQTKLLFQPQDIQIANISDTEASIIWKTQLPTIGSIKWGKESPSILRIDDRDSQLQHQRNLHFITIDNLEPDTTYLFVIQDNYLIYDDLLQNFTTAKKPVNQSLANKPIIGTLLSSNYEPESDAIVTLNLEGGSKITTYTLPSGNFLLPTTQLRTNTLIEDLPIRDGTQATLIAYNEVVESKVKIILPSLEPLQIILGNDLDLRETTLSSKIENPLDLNNDGDINTLDLSTVLNNFGKHPKEPKADINQDGVVDEKDLRELKAVLR